ncbi:fatty acid desaturase family protein [Niabella hibiscisoli]|uniref:fatty acid desaturase family protein n=1 Tax=Niabella hibiscisoli TaxID=1825928 RepID=UPI0021D437F2|nr:fatty acid desaturase [Niabella hibiscisoli]
MLSLYFVPLAVICFSGITQVWQLFCLFILSGFGMAGIGMGVMHDALHGSYSKSKVLNKWMGYTMNIIGASDEVWKLQHNVLHHSFTNIDEHDDDINAPFFSGFLRMLKRTACTPFSIIMCGYSTDCPPFLGSLQKTLSGLAVTKTRSN